jgi:hypothetical protein
LTFHLATISAAERPSMVVVGRAEDVVEVGRRRQLVRLKIGAMKTILFSLAIGDTAGPRSGADDELHVVAG